MFPLSRRRFLLGSAALGLAGCSTAIDRYAQPDLPTVLTLPGGAERHPIAHLLNRAGFGVRPGQLEQVERMGREAWLERQLDYKSIEDDKLDLRLRRYDTLKLDEADINSFSGTSNRDYVRDELAVATLVRAVFSERQLYEVMVGFWSDHFSLYHYKGDVSLLKTVDDRHVIRDHALGNFGEMLTASAHSPAMLLYLDNVLNEKSHPNENYAREIMELHTLGIDGGYTEQDIKEVARCFTGWSVDGNGKFIYIPEWHDEGAKTVLGQVISGRGGKAEGDEVLTILIQHPSTARYVSTKLLQRLVADDPSPQLLADTVATWQTSQGNIPAILKTIFTHPEFETAPLKLKRPFELLVSLLRVTNAQYDGDPALMDTLDRLGHRPFAWTTPDGYPDTAAEWSGNLLGRWNLCVDAFQGNLPGVQIDVEALEKAGRVSYNQPVEWLRFWGRLLLNRDLTQAEATPLADFMGTTQDKYEVLGLLAASPAFQWR